MLAVDSVERVPLRRITAKDAQLAGYDTLAELPTPEESRRFWTSCAGWTNGASADRGRTLCSR
ncbi:hypothetical protein [Kibdelosporangium philippinense]|uniref:hypothetical protein n=1 Tax=Kibdelosporangium philippinense TaxID=211113 RepID=UPI0036141329